MITTMRLLLLTILVAVAANVISVVMSLIQGNPDMGMFLRAWTTPEFWYTQLWMSPLYVLIALGVMLRPSLRRR